MGIRRRATGRIGTSGSAAPGSPGPWSDRRARRRRPTAASSLSPLLLGYVVAPLALAVLILFRHFGLVAQVPVWAYLVAIGAPAVLSVARRALALGPRAARSSARSAWPSTSWP